VNAIDQRPGQAGAKPAIVLVHGAFADKAAGADVVRSMARRAGADIVEIEGSHVIMISQPQAVADHILKAARTVADAHR
jgi:pimeloyl-ACP methyl ester carboxylesterase